MCHVLGVKKECCRQEKPSMIDLYYAPGSPPCRTVLLVMAALEIPVNRIVLDLRAGDHMKPEFLKINPQHIVPTIVDNGFALCESRAISRYLVNRYGDAYRLYPIDPVMRAVVDQRLDFDLGTLCLSFGQYFYPQLFGEAAPNETSRKKLDAALQFLERFLEEDSYVAGPEMTIADLCLVVTVSTIDAAEISLEPYPNIRKWFDLIKTTAPGYAQYNEKGLMEFKKLIKDVRETREQARGASKSKGKVHEEITQHCVSQAVVPKTFYQMKTMPKDVLSSSFAYKNKFSFQQPESNEQDDLENLDNLNPDPQALSQPPVKPPGPLQKSSSQKSVLYMNPKDQQGRSTTMIMPRSTVLAQAQAQVDSDTDFSKRTKKPPKVKKQ